MHLPVMQHVIYKLAKSIILIVGKYLPQNNVELKFK